MAQQRDTRSASIKEREAMLMEYQLLRQEIHVAQSQRMQVFSLSLSAFGVILSISAGIVLSSGQNIQGTQLAFAVGSGIALYSILIPSLIMIISVQQTIQRIGNYIRIFMEPEIQGLNWESRWQLMKGDKKMGGGLYKLGSIYYFLNFFPLLLPFYVASVNVQNWYLLLILVPFFTWSMYLTYDLQSAKSKSWKATTWEDYPKSIESPRRKA